MKQLCLTIASSARGHITLEGNVGSAYREQTVEIALGPKRAFENGNIGIFTRQVPAGQVISAVPPPRGKPKPPKVPRTPPVVEVLRKALEWQALLGSGEVKNQSDIARREGISRVRVTQVMWMLRLAPEIQERVLAMPETLHRPAISERALRRLAQTEDHGQQLATFQRLLKMRELVITMRASIWSAGTPRTTAAGS